MERKILKISRLDHITNDEIRKRTKIKDLLVHAKMLKWNFSGHVQRISDNLKLDIKMDQNNLKLDPSKWKKKTRPPTEKMA